MPAPTASKSERVAYVRKRTIKLIKQLEVSLADLGLRKVSNKEHKTCLLILSVTKNRRISAVILLRLE
jgi:hypothetical protein